MMTSGGRSRLSLQSQVEEPFASEVDVDLLSQVIERALAPEGLQGIVEISLVVTGDETLRQLNATYRGVDAPTDVLSFPLRLPEELVAQESFFVGPPDDVLRLGDVVISFPRAKAQAAEYGHSPRREIAYLAVHGVLHLLGYDHEDESERRMMRAKEEQALSGNLGLDRGDN